MSDAAQRGCTAWPRVDAEGNILDHAETCAWRFGGKCDCAEVYVVNTLELTKDRSYYVDVDQQRIDAARARIKRTVEYLDTISADSVYEKFGTQRIELRQALDLLNPEVKLA